MKKLSFAVILAGMLVFLWFRGPFSNPPGSETGASIQPANEATAPGPMPQASSSERNNRVQAQDLRPLDEPDARSSMAGNTHRIIDEIVVDGSIKQDGVIEILSSERYRDLHAALASEVLTPEESMRNARYRSFVENQQTLLNGELTNNGMECGKTLCVISISVNDKQAWDAFYSMLLDNGQFPIHSLTDTVIERGQHPEHRLLFSIDQRVNRILIDAGSGN